MKYKSATPEAIEDCFMRSVELLLKQDQPPNKEEVWLRRATDFLLRNELRKKEKEIPMFSAEQIPSSEQNDSTLEFDIELMFRTLPHSYSEIIRMHDIEGISFEEIGAVKCKSIEAIYKLHQRAIAKAREVLLKIGYSKPI